MPEALVPPPGTISRAPPMFRKPPLAEVTDVDVAREAMSLSIHWICSGVKGTSSSPSFVASFVVTHGGVKTMVLDF